MKGIVYTTDQMRSILLNHQAVHADDLRNTAIVAVLAGTIVGAVIVWLVMR